MHSICTAARVGCINVWERDEEKVEQMVLHTPVVKRFRRVSPSRYTAMQDCLLREVWTASGNEPLLPPSPLAKLGSVIHHLLEAAGRGHLDGGGNRTIGAAWDELVSQAEKKMTLSALQQHQVPLSRSIPDFEVRKLRACRRATEIAHDAFLSQDDLPRQSSGPTGFELWVESKDGLVGGYIDRVTMTKAGVVLSDYKSGALFDFGRGEGAGELKRAYKEQMELYAALYRAEYGNWPVWLELVPLQGTPVEVAFDHEGAERLLAEASTFLCAANKRIAEVMNGNAEITDLALPQAVHCRLCLFRPACQAYWIARKQESEEKWPADVKGFLRETTHLRSGKVCMTIVGGDSSAPTCITVRNLTDCADRHPLLHLIQPGSRLAVYGLKYHYRSADYTETQNTVIYGTD
jgi:hypothetical protein